MLRLFRVPREGAVEVGGRWGEVEVETLGPHEGLVAGVGVVVVEGEEGVGEGGGEEEEEGEA